MAELADARDLKSREIFFSYRFDPGFRHHFPLASAKPKVHPFPINLYRGVEQLGSSLGEEFKTTECCFGRTKSTEQGATKQVNLVCVATM